MFKINKIRYHVNYCDMSLYLHDLTHRQDKPHSPQSMVAERTKADSPPNPMLKSHSSGNMVVESSPPPKRNGNKQRNQQVCVCVCVCVCC